MDLIRLVETKGGSVDPFTMVISILPSTPVQGPAGAQEPHPDAGGTESGARADGVPLVSGPQDNTSKQKKPEKKLGEKLDNLLLIIYSDKKTPREF